MSDKIRIKGRLLASKIKDCNWVDKRKYFKEAEIELDITEEDIRKAITKGILSPSSCIFEEILSLLQGEKEQVIKLKNGSTIKIGGNEERLVGVDTPPKEEKSCIDCKHFKPTENLYQISVRCKQCIDKNGFEPKLKKQESPIDWEGLKTEESVSKMSNEEMRNELLKQIRKDNKLVDIVRSIYEKVEGEKK
jgi:hypothetical protein